MRQVLMGFAAGVAATLLGLIVLVAVIAAPLGHGHAPSSPAVEGPAPTEVPDDLAEGQTWLGDVDLASTVVATSDGTVRRVRVHGTGLRVRDNHITADTLIVNAVVPFETVSDRAGSGTTITGVDGSTVRVTRDVSLLGQRIGVSATGNVAAEDGLLVISPETVDVGGPDVIGAVASQLARRLITIRQPVSGLPDGLHLDAVTVTDDGFTAKLSGTDIDLGAS